MKRSTHGKTEITLEEFPFRGEFGPDLITVEVSVSYSISPYDPGCRYTRNGDGWPPSDGEVEDVTLTVKAACSYDEEGAALRFGSTLCEVQAEVNRRYEEDEAWRDSIDEQLLQNEIDVEGSERYDQDAERSAR